MTPYVTTPPSQFTSPCKTLQSSHPQQNIRLNGPNKPTNYPSLFTLARSPSTLNTQFFKWNRKSPNQSKKTNHIRWTTWYHAATCNRTPQYAKKRHKISHVPTIRVRKKHIFTSGSGGKKGTRKTIYTSWSRNERKLLISSRKRQWRIDNNQRDTITCATMVLDKYIGKAISRCVSKFIHFHSYIVSVSLCMSFRSGFPFRCHNTIKLQL